MNLILKRSCRYYTFIFTATISPLAYSFSFTNSEHPTVIVRSFISFTFALKTQGLFKGVGCKNFTVKEPVAYVSQGFLVNNLSYS